jgi:hypothetical protein
MKIIMQFKVDHTQPTRKNQIINEYTTMVSNLSNWALFGPHIVFWILCAIAIAVVLIGASNIPQ